VKSKLKKVVRHTAAAVIAMAERTQELLGRMDRVEAAVREIRITDKSQDQVIGRLVHDTAGISVDDMVVEGDLFELQEHVAGMERRHEDRLDAIEKRVGAPEQVRGCQHVELGEVWEKLAAIEARLECFGFWSESLPCVKSGDAGTPPSEAPPSPLIHPDVARQVQESHYESCIRREREAFDRGYVYGYRDGAAGKPPMDPPRESEVPHGEK